MKNIVALFTKNVLLGLTGIIISSLFVWNTAKAIRAEDTNGTASSSSSVVSSESSSTTSAGSSSSLSSSSSSSSSVSSSSSSDSSSSSVSSSSSSVSSSSSSLSSSSSSSVKSENEGDDEANENEHSSASSAWALKWLNGELHKSDTAKEHEADHRVKSLTPNQLQSVARHSEKED